MGKFPLWEGTWSILRLSLLICKLRIESCKVMLRTWRESTSWERKTWISQGKKLLVCMKTTNVWTECTRFSRRKHSTVWRSSSLRKVMISSKMKLGLSMFKLIMCQLVSRKRDINHWELILLDKVQKEVQSTDQILTTRRHKTCGRWLMMDSDQAEISQISPVSMLESVPKVKVGEWVLPINKSPWRGTFHETLCEWQKYLYF